LSLLYRRISLRADLLGTVKSKLLIFELRMMGDAVMSLPFVRVARQRYSVHVCCHPANVDVFRTHLPADQIIPWLPPWFATTPAGPWEHWRRSGFRDFIRKVRSIRADIALGVWGEARTHVLLRLSGAPVRIGLPMNRRNFYGSQLSWRRLQIWLGRGLVLLATVGLGRKLLTKKINRRSYLQHHLVDWEQMAEAVGLLWDTSPPWFQAVPGRLPVPVAEWLEAGRVRQQRAWLWHLGARWPGRRWPVERIRTVIQKFFLPRKIPLLLLQSPEAEIPPELVGIAPAFIPADLPELITILNAADFLVCNDTGVGHLGSALGKRVITIFGAGMPEWIAPFGNADFIVRQPVCPHHPCLDRCVQPSYICRDAVTEEMVERQIARVLADSLTSSSSLSSSSS